MPSLGKDHEDYFYNYFPSILEEFIDAVRAIAFLHDSGEKHGDIRRDHLIKDRSTGIYRWIDFDYNYRHGASRFGYDLFGLGNVLIFITGRGDVTTYDLLRNEPHALNQLSLDDMNGEYNIIVLCAESDKPLADVILDFRCELSCCTVVVGRHHHSKA